MTHPQRNCQELLASLSEYVDGDLSKELCAEIERHLEECHDCQVVVNTLRKTIDLYRQVELEDELPKSVMQKLYFRLNIEDYLSR
ncbi:putative zinc-finger [Anaerolinea thermolimosa]|uniref:anti-sigma factor family protein n=1 Tax=Anaerolinea thermolimosa TaxID=229919 RepID=UPI0007849510|nr:zf-HC2 domain-containing protein [Anaerolinea thermolimosa]GAP06308.1 putative zinc-finger [Anaerolinea thermolimosa]